MGSNRKTYLRAVQCAYLYNLKRGLDPINAFLSAMTMVNSSVSGPQKTEMKTNHRVDKYGALTFGQFMAHNGPTHLQVDFRELDKTTYTFQSKTTIGGTIVPIESKVFEELPSVGCAGDDMWKSQRKSYNRITCSKSFERFTGRGYYTQRGNEWCATPSSGGGGNADGMGYQLIPSSGMIIVSIASKDHGQRVSKKIEYSMLHYQGKANKNGMIEIDFPWMSQSHCQKYRQNHLPRTILRISVSNAGNGEYFLRKICLETRYGNESARCPRISVDDLPPAISKSITGTGTFERELELLFQTKAQEMHASSQGNVSVTDCFSLLRNSVNICLMNENQKLFKLHHRTKCPLPAFNPGAFGDTLAQMTLLRLLPEADFKKYKHKQSYVCEVLLARSPLGGILKQIYQDQCGLRGPTLHQLLLGKSGLPEHFPVVPSELMKHIETECFSERPSFRSRDDEIESIFRQIKLVALPGSFINGRSNVGNYVILQIIRMLSGSQNEAEELKFTARSLGMDDFSIHDDEEGRRGGGGEKGQFRRSSYASFYTDSVFSINFPGSGSPKMRFSGLVKMARLFNTQSKGAEKFRSICKPRVRSGELPSHAVGFGGWGSFSCPSAVFFGGDNKNHSGGFHGRPSVWTFQENGYYDQENNSLARIVHCANTQICTVIQIRGRNQEDMCALTKDILAVVVRNMSGLSARHCVPIKPIRAPYLAHFCAWKEWLKLPPQAHSGHWTKLHCIPIKQHPEAMYFPGLDSSLRRKSSSSSSGSQNINLTEEDKRISPLSLLDPSTCDQKELFRALALSREDLAHLNGMCPYGERLSVVYNEKSRGGQNTGYHLVYHGEKQGQDKIRLGEQSSIPLLWDPNANQFRTHRGEFVFITLYQPSVSLVSALSGNNQELASPQASIPPVVVVSALGACYAQKGFVLTLAQRIQRSFVNNIKRIKNLQFIVHKDIEANRSETPTIFRSYIGSRLIRHKDVDYQSGAPVPTIFCYDPYSRPPHCGPPVAPYLTPEYIRRRVNHWAPVY